MSERAEGIPVPEVPRNPDSLLEDVIKNAHNLRDSLLHLNDRHTDLLREFELPTTERYVIRAAANDIVPVPHDRYSLGPRHRMDPIEGIEELRVRIPVIEVVNHNEEEDVDELETSDVFFEVVHSKDRLTSRYLLNAAGFWQYFNAADLEPNASITTPGLYAAPRALVVPSDRQMLELIGELIGEEPKKALYRPLQVDNRPADAA